MGDCPHAPSQTSLQPPCSRPTASQFILGNTGFSQASISHQPSNAELVMRSVRSMSNLLQRGGNGGGRSRRGSGSGSGAWSVGASPALTPLLTPREVSVEEAAQGAAVASGEESKQPSAGQAGSP